MRILLINPSSFNLYTHIGAQMPPLGIAYLAAVLKEKGHSPEIFDMDVMPGKPDYKNYRIVGISCLTSTYLKGLEIAREVKDAGRIVVMGGYHPTFMDGEVLKTGLVDYVVRGEGEYVLPELVNHIEGDADVKDVKGISYMDGNKLIRTENAPYPDVDKIPLPARDILPLSSYKAFLDERPMTPVITSRGCPFNCSFCASSKFGGLKWRARSALSVIEEVEILKERYGFGSIDFMDDNFTMNPARVVKISEGLLERDVGIKWWCLSRADTIVKNEDMVKVAVRSGLNMVFLGIESVEEDILRSYGKREDTTTFANAITLLKRYGVKTWASIMIGALNETGSMISRTINFIKKLDPHAVQISILTPYPGTRLFEEVKGRITTWNWNLYDGAHAVFNTYHLNTKKIQSILRKAYLNIYLAPKRVVREIRHALEYHLVKRLVVSYPRKAIVAMRYIR
ncbi:MAG: radical SAM protein [candidate division WOR-3 bacterium]|nr:radical SAM protein [candidate division WOR-3 bacterium]